MGLWVGESDNFLKGLWDEYASRVAAAEESPERQCREARSGSKESASADGTVLQRIRRDAARFTTATV